MSKKLMAMAAKKRQSEIQRKTKAQELLCSGWGVQSSHAQLTDTNRLIRCDHYKRSGANARIAFQREKLDNLKRRLKEAKNGQGLIFRHVKRDEKGKTLSVVEKIK